jgi:hypothetical protein
MSHQFSFWRRLPVGILFGGDRLSEDGKLDILGGGLCGKYSPDLNRPWSETILYCNMDLVHDTLPFGQCVTFSDKILPQAALLCKTHV